jgi:multicomponent K+:H+ antiporter subunit A
MVAGTRWVEAHLRLPVLRWIGAGLLVAVATGLGALLLGYPFLTTHTAHLHLPLLGDIHLASALFFDLGVFAVVLGSTLLVLTALAHQSVRGRRPTPDAGAPEAG